jgi:arylsulfatase
MVRSIAFPAAVSLGLSTVFGLPAQAQDVLPRPEQPFKGHMGRTVEESIKDFPQEVKAPEGAPNILLILTDDVGFGE